MKLNTKFTPLTHGYSFPNRFEFTGFTKIVKFVKSKLIYGMCGGMVFSALDYYFDQRKIPEFMAVRELPLNYTKFLWKRQTESVSLAVFVRIIQFASFTKSKAIQKSFQEELPLILDRVEDGLPAPLVIIRSSLFQNPTHNHQVLVIGFEEKADQLELILYDPNHPRIQPSLVIRPAPAYSITQSTGEPIRAFFLNHYTYQFSYDQG